jgi:hypothetical protein
MLRTQSSCTVQNGATPRLWYSQVLRCSAVYSGSLGFESYSSHNLRMACISHICHMQIQNRYLKTAQIFIHPAIKY